MFELIVLIYRLIYLPCVKGKFFLFSVIFQLKKWNFLVVLIISVFTKYCVKLLTLVFFIYNTIFKIVINPIINMRVKDTTLNFF